MPRKFKKKNMPKFIPNTCPENFFKKTQIRNDAVFVYEDLEGALAGDDLSPEPMQYSLCLAHNESPYVVLFLLADPALAGDDLAPDLIDGFRNRNGIRGFDEGDLGVEEEGRVCGGGGGGLIERFGRGR